ncbi:hypothetical protein BCR32DRAFT_283901 [Anaeromyces robustus]|uniref:PHD-type domain-containing protein n=1 Tax=Anaeromyces robustus TaxID=1754192 RepID=A0A1Y1WT28_9FUNG|nr:hypothetical protein BCR32DRAFT_283901 [Anaeromyces robustus]|eukprot:ORX76687.1 hypothetical protein BCR32DRAFT_283901 [Anaeromyces robustus]
MTNISDDESSAITQCICGKNSPQYDGLMIQCEDCGVWQHGICVNITKKNTPKNYYCQKCRPEYHPYNSHLLNKSSKKSSTNPNSPPSKTFSPVTSSPKKRNTMNSLEASQNYNAILNLNANISSGESEPSSTTSSKRKRKTPRNFSQDLSYSSNNSDSTSEKLKKIRKVHSQIEYDKNDDTKLKDNISKDSKRHHKAQNKSYNEYDDEMDDFDDIEDDIDDDDDYIPNGDGKSSRNLFNKKHENNSSRKVKLDEESDHGKIKIKKDELFDDKNKKGDSKNYDFKQENNIKIKKERKGSKLNIEFGSSGNESKSDIKSEDSKVNETSEKVSKNKKNHTNETSSHLLRSSSELEIENSNRSPPALTRKSSQRTFKYNNDNDESKSELYNSPSYRNGYDNSETLNNQNTNLSSNTTSIHISTRHSTRNTHRVNYQLNSASSHNNTHHKNGTTIKVRYPNQKTSINEMNKRANQILEYLNRTRSEIKELYRKNKLNSIIQAGGKVDIKEYKNEGHYSNNDIITDSIVSSPENNDTELNGLEMLEKLCLRISKFQQDYYT